MTRNTACAPSRAIRRLGGPQVVRAKHQLGPSVKPGGPFRVFLDDARNPPLNEKGWVVVRTVKDAISLMLEHGTLVTTLSLDNDLNESEEGIDFLKWVMDSSRFPQFSKLEKIIIHTGNDPKARMMRRLLLGSEIKVKRVIPSSKIYPDANKDDRVVIPYKYIRGNHGNLPTLS